MPSNKEKDRAYSVAALRSIKKAVSTSELYEAIHGRPPVRMELQRFSYRLNPARADPAASFLGLCAASVPALRQMTLAEFFGLDGDA